MPFDDLLNRLAALGAIVGLFGLYRLWRGRTAH